MSMLQRTPSPYTCFTMILLFKQRRMDLTRETYDQCVDVIIGVLEEANNETWRLDVPPPKSAFTPES